MAVINEGDKHTFVCDEPRCGWRSIGWDTPEQASARGDQHFAEHATGELMQELTEFEASVGFIRTEG